MAHATVAFTDLENREGTGFANMSEFEGDEMNLETQISSRTLLRRYRRQKPGPAAECCTR